MKKVFVNGTFDILHLGHLELLNYAKTRGDYLLVCIDTDRRVREKKGSTRPINNENERMILLQNLRCVDAVRLFDSDEELKAILESYEPNVIVKGSDHKNSSQLSAQYCDEVIFYDRLEQYSTTKKIQDIASR